MKRAKIIKKLSLAYWEVYSRKLNLVAAAPLTFLESDIVEDVLLFVVGQVVDLAGEGKVYAGELLVQTFFIRFIVLLKGI